MKSHLWGLFALIIVGGLVAAPFVHAPGASKGGMPPLAEGLHISQTVIRTIDVPQEQLRAWLSTANLSEIAPGSSMMPSIRETRTLSGVWGQPGATRRVFLSDGSTVLETFITERRDGYSSYYFTPETGPGRRLVLYVRGEFLFTALPEGRTRVEWRYSIKPRSPWAAPHVLLYSFPVHGFLESAIDAIKRGAEAAERRGEDGGRPAPSSPRRPGGA